MANIKYILPFIHLSLICPFNSHLLPFPFRCIKLANSPPRHLNPYQFKLLLPAPDTLTENSNRKRELAGCFLPGLRWDWPFSGTASKRQQHYFRVDSTKLDNGDKKRPLGGSIPRSPPALIA